MSLIFKLTIDISPYVLNSLNNCSYQKTNSPKKFIFSGHIALAAAIKHDLINPPLVNAFPCLANK